MELKAGTKLNMTKLFLVVLEKTKLKSLVQYDIQANENLYWNIQTTFCIWHKADGKASFLLLIPTKQLGMHKGLVQMCTQIDVSQR